MHLPAQKIEPNDFISEYSEESSNNSIIELTEKNSFTLTFAEPLLEERLGRIRLDATFCEYNQTILFYDEVRNKVYSSNLNGVIENVAGRSGRGPGELLSVESFACAEDNSIWVYESQQMLVKKFNQSGAIKDEVEFNFSDYSYVGSYMIPHNGRVYMPVIRRDLLSRPTEAADSPLSLVFD